MLLQSSGVEFSVERGDLRVKIYGDVDHHSAKNLRGKIDRELFAIRPKKLIFDLVGVDFMDSSGLGLILGRAAKAGTIGGQVAVENASKRVIKVLLLAGADRMVDIKDAKGEVKNEI